MFHSPYFSIQDLRELRRCLELTISVLEKVLENRVSFETSVLMVTLAPHGLKIEDHNEFLKYRVEHCKKMVEQIDLIISQK